MVNLWGPGAFGAARPAAVRPTYSPNNGAGDPDDWFKDCSSPADRDGTEWRAAGLNMLLALLRQVVRRSSVAPTNLDDDLLIKAIASGNVTHAVATGSANAWVVAPSLAVPAYAGGRVLWVKAPATNTATTVTADVSGLGARPVKKADGANPAIGDLVAGRWYPTIDDGTSICIVATLGSDIVAAAMPIPSRISVFNASGTYTKPSNLVAAKVTMVGGGGAGGVGDSGGYIGGGGASAAEVNAYFMNADLGATESVVVGTGAPSVAPTGMAGGAAGGNTQFRNMIARGGGGGGTGPGIHGAGGLGGSFTVTGPGVGIGISGGNGPSGARWDTSSSKGAIGRGGSGGSFDYALGGTGGNSGIVIIEEYLRS